jgi:hypothetical protein
MPVSWKPSSHQEHERLPRKRTGAQQDPAWEEVMHALRDGQVVQLQYDDDKEAGSLARSIGRRAAHRGMQIDMRRGQDQNGSYLSVRQVGDAAEGANGRRGGRRNAPVTS